VDLIRAMRKASAVPLWGGMSVFRASADFVSSCGSSLLAKVGIDTEIPSEIESRGSLAYGCCRNDLPAWDQSDRFESAIDMVADP
jgi:hypothetical protein